MTPALLPGGVGCNAYNVGELAQLAVDSFIDMQVQIQEQVIYIYKTSGCRS